ncbi:electron transporter RnfD [Alkalispirochaeta odontotermitis]|uniref:RnfABCDGE type electron transport complex subunit D n=1 Tax=Olavius algarvensis spirochete endosymbiont TaxID=260710 RepID=UPI00052CC85C|nr:RnfABCDGE type electron transport complex subunit D [Olavius algarvensis spirochete endosymbiont]KGM38807.1 electron transporter RnfD [Alkalispirochaeta odontotermitis]
MKPLPLISTSPQIHVPHSTRKMMAWVLVSLVPAFAWGVYIFGFRALLVVGIAVISAVLTEGLLNIAFGRPNSLGDLSAIVTGVLIGFNMPAQISLFIPAVASIFAIAVVKWSFGGLGANWMNPAMAGRVFVFYSWGAEMTHFTIPRTLIVDATSGATPLETVKSNLLSLTMGGPPGELAGGPMELLEKSGFPGSYFDLWIGRMAGSLGEVSALLLILGAIILTVKRILNWEIPLAYIGSFAFLIWLFDGIQYGNGAFGGDVLFHLLTGGLMLGALYMATDLVTTPLTKPGRIIFGLGCGLLTFVIRRFGSLAEGVSLAIIFMNILVPLIDRFVKPKRYGIQL